MKRVSPLAAAVAGALVQHGLEIRARRDAAFRRAWNRTEKPEQRVDELEDLTNKENRQCAANC